MTSLIGFLYRQCDGDLDDGDPQYLWMILIRL